MIDYSNEKERALLYQYAKQFDYKEAVSVLEKGQVSNEEDVRSLARLYWRMVDEAAGENMDYWLEKIYTSLHIHMGNRGFEEEWDKWIPRT